MAEQTPIWKKEIRLRKRGTSIAAPEPPVAAAAPTGREEKRSIWKRELRLGRSSGSPSSPVPANPGSSPAPPEEPAMEPGEPQLAAAVAAEHPAIDDRTVLLEPLPAWEGSPPAMPFENPAPPPPIQAHVPGPSDAGEPVWERAEPELETVGGWNLDWSSEYESEPQRSLDPSRPAESAFESAAPVANPAGRVEPPAARHWHESEAPRASEDERVEEPAALEKPIAMPFENAPALSPPLASHVPEPRNAGEPVRERAEPELDTGGGWNPDWSSEYESESQRSLASSRPAEPAFESAAPVANPAERVEPPAASHWEESEAPRASEAERFEEPAALDEPIEVPFGNDPAPSPPLGAHVPGPTDSGERSWEGAEPDLDTVEGWNKDSSSGYESDPQRSLDPSRPAESASESAPPFAHPSERVEPPAAAQWHESGVPRASEPERVEQPAALEPVTPWTHGEAPAAERTDVQADSVGEWLRERPTENDVSPGDDGQPDLQAHPSTSPGPGLEDLHEWPDTPAIADSAGSVSPPAEIPVAVAIPLPPEAEQVDVVPEPGLPVEPESPQPPPVSAPKPSLLKRELRMPRPRRRKATASAPSHGASSRSKNLVGLRVGSSQLAAACIHNNGSAELVQVARSRLEPGIVSGGEVRDPEALTRALKAFFAEHKLPRRGVRIGIASNRIGVRILDVPANDDPKLFENSVRFHAQEALPIAVTDAIIQHIVLGEGAEIESEPTVRVLLVFAHRELVDRHVDACRRAGLKLEGIDFEAFALLRALAAPRPEDVEPERAVVAVAVGNERTIFAVSDGRICDFTRVLEWGGGSLDVAIARTLDLTPSQAEPIKLALTLDGEPRPSELNAEQVDSARAAVRSELQSLARELVSSLQFYQARPGSLDIGEILISGGSAQLSGLAEELERLVGVPVRVGDPYSRIQLAKKVTRSADSGSLAVAIGLGIED